MKYLIKAETCCGSISDWVEAENIKEAKLKTAHKLKLMGREEVVGRKPNFSEFRISKNSDTFIKLRED